jgi:hypothetical protein
VRANLSQREPAFPGEADDCCSDTLTFLDATALFVTLRTANLASFVAAIDPARDAAEA